MPLLTYSTLYILMWFENDRKTIKVADFRKRFKNCICNINIAVNRYNSSINTSTDRETCFIVLFKKTSFCVFQCV